MINTFFSSGALDSGGAAVASLLIGAAFGFVLQRAGFSSSRILSGVFYFRNMTVIKVMFTAVITAMLGLIVFEKLGWTTPENIYLLPTVYAAQIVGGLLFGVGFVMGGWCPGTAIAGLAQGKIDALIFLVGAVLGSIFFNEIFGIIKPLYKAGSAGIIYIYDSLNVSRETFVVGFTLIGILVFALCEYLDRITSDEVQEHPKAAFKAVSLGLLSLAVFLWILPAADVIAPENNNINYEARLLDNIESAYDHIEPEKLADMLMAHESNLLLVDIRPADEYLAGHIPGAINIAMKNLHEILLPHRNVGKIILYSNGMTHPSQSRDSLARAGFENVFILTDGLIGFRERCLKPVSLRSEPVSIDQAAAINRWRDFFNTPANANPPAVSFVEPLTLPGALVETGWLNENLSNPGLVIIDVRNQAQYNSGHIPGSLALGCENLRTNVNGLGSMLSPVELLSKQFSLLGIVPEDKIILVSSEGIRDATLVGLALERAGHTAYALLNGGFDKWILDKMPVNTDIPDVTPSIYPIKANADGFTVQASAVLEALRGRKTVILDVRPVDYYQGIKSDEARAGHIPKAVNRPFQEDIQKQGTVTSFKSPTELGVLYSQLIPSKRTPVIVHCRTGHQASQTVFVLKRILGYENVFWYDGGWSEWASRSSLPI